MDVLVRSYEVDQDFDVMKDGSKKTSILKVSFDLFTTFSWLKCLPVKRKYYKFDSYFIKPTSTAQYIFNKLRNGLLQL